MELLGAYRNVIENAVLFVVVFLLVGIGARALLRRLISAVDPSAGRGTTKSLKSKTRIFLAVADLTAWLFALMIASEVLRVHRVVTLIMIIVAYIPIAVALLLLGGLVAYSFSKAGNELVLSLIGYWYLNRETGKLNRRRDHDLGNGRIGKIIEIAPLHTTFSLSEGGTETRSNAYLMRQFFGLGHYLTPTRTDEFDI